MSLVSELEKVIVNAPSSDATEPFYSPEPSMEFSAIESKSGRLRGLFGSIKDKFKSRAHKPEELRSTLRQKIAYAAGMVAVASFMFGSTEPQSDPVPSNEAIAENSNSADLLDNYHFLNEITPPSNDIKQPNNTSGIDTEKEVESNEITIDLTPGDGITDIITKLHSPTQLSAKESYQRYQDLKSRELLREDHLSGVTIYKTASGELRLHDIDGDDKITLSQELVDRILDSN